MSAAPRDVLRRAILDGSREGIGPALDRALGNGLETVEDRTNAAHEILHKVLLPAMDEVRARFGAGELILPQVLSSAAAMRQALDVLEPMLQGRPDAYRGSIVVATLEGDVHHISKSLLITLLRVSGYRVHDLGSQVPVGTIVDAAVEHAADAIGLSAMLISTSRQMPTCIQELDRRGVHLPVLVGGAAINRAFGRRAAILPDGRIYEPGVFYCRDVFDGVAALDELTSSDRREGFIDRTRAEIMAERDRQETPALQVTGHATSAPPREVEPPRAPFSGPRRVEADLREVWQHLDLNTLFRHHWGGHRASSADYDRLAKTEFPRLLGDLQADALQNGWLEALIVAGYFTCKALGNQLVLYAADGTTELTRLDFPRQADGDRLCLADYFHPHQPDVVGLQAVSAGARAGEYVDELQRSGDYPRMLYVNGLAASTAEALAEYGLQLARRELGLDPNQGLRFSWGYPACPDLEEQRKVLPLLEAERLIGLRLSASANLDPEHSTAAMIVPHPEVKYFAVRA